MSVEPSGFVFSADTVLFCNNIRRKENLVANTKVIDNGYDNILVGISIRTNPTIQISKLVSFIQ